MLIEYFLNRVVDIFGNILNGLSIVPLPTDAIRALASILVYGNYIIGTDLMIVLFGSIMGWLSIRCGIGIAVFIWRLLPFT